MLQNPEDLVSQKIQEALQSLTQQKKTDLATVGKILKKLNGEIPAQSLFRASPKQNIDEQNIAYLFKNEEKLFHYLANEDYEEQYKDDLRKICSAEYAVPNYGNVNERSNKGNEVDEIIKKFKKNAEIASKSTRINSDDESSASNLVHISAEDESPASNLAHINVDEQSMIEISVDDSIEKFKDNTKIASPAQPQPAKLVNISVDDEIEDSEAPKPQTIEPTDTSIQNVYQSSLGSVSEKGSDSSLSRSTSSASSQNWDSTQYLAPDLEGEGGAPRPIEPSTGIAGYPHFASHSSISSNSSPSLSPSEIDPKFLKDEVLTALESILKIIEENPNDSKLKEIKEGTSSLTQLLTTYAEEGLSSEDAKLALRFLDVAISQIEHHESEGVPTEEIEVLRKDISLLQSEFSREVGISPDGGIL